MSLKHAGKARFGTNIQDHWKMFVYNCFLTKILKFQISGVCV